MKQGIRQWFKSPSCCFNWIILFWSGVWFAVLWLSVKLSCAIFALCQIYSRCCASGNQSTDLNSISIFSYYIILIFCIWEIQWSRSCSIALFFIMKVLFSGVCSWTTEVKSAELFCFLNILIKRTLCKDIWKKQVRMLLSCLLHMWKT